MDNCIFCQIVAGQLPASKVYEDDDVLAFLDISQVTKGHTLVIPKKHVRNLLDMSEATASKVFSKVPRIARAVQKATGASGVNLLNNSEEVAGQTVFHAHIHILPRFSQEDDFAFTFVTKDPDFPALTSLAQQIAKEVTE